MGLAVTTTICSVIDDLNVLMDLMKRQISAQTISFSFVFFIIKVFGRLYVRVGVLHKCGNACTCITTSVHYERRLRPI
jgi:hypothetical protein